MSTHTSAIWRSIKSIVKEPILDIIYFFYKLFRISDKAFVRIQYFFKTRRILNLGNPQTFNEKLQWLKLYNDKPEYTVMVDKATSKDYVRKLIGEKYIIPTLGIWERFDDIDFDKLPNQFVLKCTHDSGGVTICNDKTTFNRKEARKRFNHRLKRNFYYWTREHPYRSINPRIIAEKYLDAGVTGLNDYKFFCFEGEVKAIQVDFDRFTTHKRNIYTPDWEYIPLSIKYPSDFGVKIEKPRKLNEMIEISRKLSAGFSHLRVDLYCVDDEIYFGELTLHHGGGYERFVPQSYGKVFGNWICLPLNTKPDN